MAGVTAASVVASRLVSLPVAGICKVVPVTRPPVAGDHSTQLGATGRSTSFSQNGLLPDDSGIPPALAERLITPSEQRRVFVVGGDDDELDVADERADRLAIGNFAPAGNRERLHHFSVR